MPPVLLLVEDVDDARELYREMFELDGWRVIAVRTAEEAVSIARAYTIDAVLTDHNLGDGMTGIALSHLLVNENLVDGRRIVVCSGESAHPAKPYDVWIARKPVELRKLSMMLGKLVKPKPLLTVYICGTGEMSKNVVHRARKLVEGRHVNVDVVDLLTSQANVNEANITFTPSIVLRYKGDRWRFVGDLQDTRAIEACINYLESVAL